MDYAEREQRIERDGSVFIRESRKALKRNIFAAVGMNLLYLSLYALFISVVAVLVQKTAFTVGVLVVSLSVEIFLLYRAIRKRKRKYSEFVGRFYEMPDWEFSSLCRQAAESPLYFGKIYLLEEHIYVPRHMLLLKLEEIQNLRAVLRRTNFMYSGASLNIYHHGVITSVEIPDIYEFRQKCSMFINMIFARRDEVKRQHETPEYQKERL